jgi:hypothetical protein
MGNRLENRRRSGVVLVVSKASLAIAVARRRMVLADKGLDADQINRRSY